MTVQIHPKYVKRNDHVDLWDLGPVRPMPPEAPVEPDKSKLKGADLALAQIHYEDSFETYKTALRHYGRLKEEHATWHKVNGGPLKVDFWSTDAVSALTLDPDRYCLELPKGMKPGKAQIEADRRAEMTEQELQEAREKDPQFGKGNQR
ncbi:MULTISPECIES: hypothetical protein [unclassified Bradyrhizobium]|uniref:hypothetical protein n=1 Tax=unclassified Bradyrhizobium TaxID=2631580 RepID=UPI0024790D5A|nr:MULTISPECIES: hypothetical protein [unclassified Bradyrhizobium]WGR74339.1 hypothetical protein MTX24_16575 [Bradyrhizobium sp. ISRA426]WGR79174.1 hypothetical protein MTX21_01690 [Bradyrhizobium sp. ISRA430]WGR90595.1 hypothetical protein MTX25_39835 [Bradyrhizobium sp. ISRA432]